MNGKEFIPQEMAMAQLKKQEIEPVSNFVAKMNVHNIA